MPFAALDSEFAPDLEARAAVGLARLGGAPISRLVALNRGVKLRGLTHVHGRSVVFTVLGRRTGDNRSVFNSNMLRVLRSKFNFLHSTSDSCLTNPSSVCISPDRVHHFGLHANSAVSNGVHPPGRNRHCFTLLGIGRIGFSGPRGTHGGVLFRGLAPLRTGSHLHVRHNGNSARSLATHMLSLTSPVNHNRHNLVITPPGTNGAVLLRGVTRDVTCGRPSYILVILLVSRHPRRMARVRHLMGNRIITSAFSRPTSHRIRITRVIVRGTGHLIRRGGSIVVLLSSVAHLTHTCGAIIPTSNGILANNISTGTLRHPGHFFNTTHGIRRNNDLAVVTATLVSANSGVSRIVCRRFGNANGVRLRLSHGVTRGHIFPTVSCGHSNAHGRRLLAARRRLRGV